MYKSNRDKNKLSYVYRGKVLDNTDPMNLGRCKIKVPSIHGSVTISPNMLPWARPICVTPVNSSRGSYSIPDIGDIVWVLFEGGDENSPIYLGGTYGSEDIKIQTDRVVLYEEGDTSISLDRSSGDIEIESGKSHILLKKDSSITLEASQINMKGNELNLDFNHINGLE